MAVAYLGWGIVLSPLHNPPLKLLVMREANCKAAAVPVMEKPAKHFVSIRHIAEGP
jgi:hypothetical protein